MPKHMQPTLAGIAAFAVTVAAILTCAASTGGAPFA